MHALTTLVTCSSNVRCLSTVIRQNIKTSRHDGCLNYYDSFASVNEDADEYNDELLVSHGRHTRTVGVLSGY